MARGIILREMDPIIADGAVFEFVEAAPGSMPNFCWLSPRVPAPNARVDLLEAWDVAQRDARACRATLECDGSIEAALRVYLNTVAWVRFWSVRFPNAEWRAAFAQELEAREEALTELKAGAFRKGKFEVVEALGKV